MKKLALALILSFFSTTSYADYDLSCKKGEYPRGHGRAFPLHVNETRNTLTWLGKTYHTTPSQYDDQDGQGCGKSGWKVNGDGTSFRLCFTTKDAELFTSEGKYMGWTCDVR
jgi:hypothetical protein